MPNSPSAPRHHAARGRQGHECFPHLVLPQPRDKQGRMRLDKYKVLWEDKLKCFEEQYN